MTQSRASLILMDTLLQAAKRMEKLWYAKAYRDLALASETFPALSFEPDSLLIFKPDDIGDAVQALPAIAEVKKRFPKTRIHALVQDKAAPVYERSGLIDEMVTVPVKVRALRFQSFDIAKALAAFSVPTFDVAIFLRTYPIFFSEFRQVSARIKVHPRDPRLSSDSSHQSRVQLWNPLRPSMALQLLQTVAPLTGREYSPESIHYPTFTWKQKDKELVKTVWGEVLPDQYGVMHPFNRFETKRYGQWKELSQALCKKFSFPWFVIGGKEDSRLDLPEGVRQWQGRLDLGATGYLLSKAAVFVGNESGPGHWSAAMGTKTVTIMGGHSFVGEWAPLGKSLVLRHPVSCSPCHLRVCPVQGLKCLTALTPEFIADEVENFLAR